MRVMDQGQGLDLELEMREQVQGLGQRLGTGIRDWSQGLGPCILRFKDSIFQVTFINHNHLARTVYFPSTPYNLPGPDIFKNCIFYSQDRRFYHIILSALQRVGLEASIDGVLSQTIGYSHEIIHRIGIVCDAGIRNTTSYQYDLVSIRPRIYTTSYSLTRPYVVFGRICISLLGGRMSYCSYPYFPNIPVPRICRISY